MIDIAGQPGPIPQPPFDHNGGDDTFVLLNFR
jgi:hypothetical protein